MESESLDVVDITPTMVENIVSMRKNLEEVFYEYKEIVSKNVLHRKRTSELCTDRQPPMHLEMNILTTIKDMQENYYLVQKNDLERIFNEVKQLKDMLPKFVNKDLMSAPYRLHLQDLELKSLRLEKENLDQRVEGLKLRQEAILTELDREKQSNLKLKQEVKNLNEINEKHTLYCVELGAVTCQLLWRASEQDETVSKMLNGTHGEQFLELANYTLESYLSSFQDSNGNINEINVNNSFVFMLLGFITNISASAYGREFLASQKCDTVGLLHTLVSMNSVIPLNKIKWERLRNLILKSIYNMSLNEKGFILLCSKKLLFKTLASIVEEDNSLDNRLQATRIIHSILLESNYTQVFQDIMEVLPVQKVQNLILSERSGMLKNELKDLAVLQSRGMKP